MRMTDKEYQEYINKQGQAKPQQQLSLPRDPKRKLRNIPKEVDGYTFSSKLEALRYEQLKFLAMVGDIGGFGVQPSFVLCSGLRYVPDFIVCGRDGTIWVEDTKGFETATFAAKAKMFRSAYPWLELRILKKEDI